jgi:uncharacterized MAPEG superfamily protein
MSINTQTELFYLILTCLVTALMWIPYILNSFIVRGIWGTMQNPSADARPLSLWAQRLKSAHANAVENLVVFAPLALAVHILGTSNNVTVAAVTAYFWARVAHYIIYGLGIPGLRTVAFLIGWAAIIALAVQLLP